MIVTGFLFGLREVVVEGRGGWCCCLCLLLGGWGRRRLLFFISVPNSLGEVDGTDCAAGKMGTDWTLTCELEAYEYDQTRWHGTGSLASGLFPENQTENVLGHGESLECSTFFEQRIKF